MIEFSRSIPIGSLRSLEMLDLDNNQIGDAGMVEFSRQITIGSLASLTDLDVDDEEHPQLKAACRQRGIRVHQRAPM